MLMVACNVHAWAGGGLACILAGELHVQHSKTLSEQLVHVHAGMASQAHNCWAGLEQQGTPGPILSHAEVDCTCALMPVLP